MSVAVHLPVFVKIRPTSGRALVAVPPMIASVPLSTVRSSEWDVGIAQDASKAYPGGEIGRVMSESRAKDLLGLRELIALPQLLRQRKEKAGLRIGFHPKPQFLDLWVIRRHGIKTLPQKRTAPEGAVRDQVQCSIIIVRCRPTGTSCCRRSS